MKLHQYLKTNNNENIEYIIVPPLVNNVFAKTEIKKYKFRYLRYRNYYVKYVSKDQKQRRYLIYLSKHKTDKK